MQKLLEYKKYKETLESFRGLEKDRSDKFKRGGSKEELRRIAETALVDVELESITLFKLLKTFEKIIERLSEKKTVAHTIARYDYTILEQQNYLFSNIKARVKSSFEDIFLKLENRIHAIVTFLGMLELLSQQKLVIIQGEGANHFWLTVPDDDEEE